MSRIQFPAVLLLVGIIVHSSLAQDPPEVIELYGNGVHAYFSHQSTKARDLFTRAIEAGTKDPRVFYFRAMTLMQLGSEQEAMSDMQIGAALEAEQTHSAYPVDRSLERIQGHGRLILEKYRRNARIAALQNRQTIQSLKYEESREREADVLRRQVHIGVDDIQPSPENVTAEPGVVRDQPIPANGSPRPLAPAPDAAQNLFAPTAPGAAVPASPSSDAAATAPVTEQPGNSTPEVPKDDDNSPTTGQEPADIDPFGDAEAPSEPAVQDSTPDTEDVSVDVGEKVSRKKLSGILGGLITKPIGGLFKHTAENVASQSENLPGAGLRSGPGMGPGMGPDSAPAELPRDPGMQESDLLELEPTDSSEEDPFKDDPEETPAPPTEATDAVNDVPEDPFGDDSGLDFDLEEGPEETSPENGVPEDAAPEDINGNDLFGDAFNEQNDGDASMPADTLGNGSDNEIDNSFEDTLSSHEIPDDPFDVD